MLEVCGKSGSLLWILVLGKKQDISQIFYYLEKHVERKGDKIMKKIKLEGREYYKEKKADEQSYLSMA